MNQQVAKAAKAAAKEARSAAQGVLVGLKGHASDLVIGADFADGRMRDHLAEQARRMEQAARMLRAALEA